MVEKKSNATSLIQNWDRFGNSIKILRDLVSSIDKMNPDHNDVVKLNKSIQNVSLLRESCQNELLGINETAKSDIQLGSYYSIIYIEINQVYQEATSIIGDALTIKRNYNRKEILLSSRTEQPTTSNRDILIQKGYDLQDKTQVTS